MIERLVSPIAIVFILILLMTPAGPAADDDLVPLFNGKDLTGWVNANCALRTLAVRDGLIVSTGKPSGFLRTEKQYENFILELEYKHLAAKGNAGLYVWLQHHGDEIQFANLFLWDLE